MQDYQREFIKFSIENNVLLFGTFTLKSGRTSPYFFNSGLFNTGRLLARLGEFYAKAIEHANLEYDMLFGPAYKGIPLVSSVAIALANQQGRDVPYCFNRKEPKDHGEGGLLVGAKLQGRVLVVDDVISAGTTAYEVLDLVKNLADTQIVGMAIALNRQERGSEKGATGSTIDILAEKHNLTVVAIITLENITEYLKGQDGEENAKALALITAYKKEYGIISIP